MRPFESTVRSFGVVVPLAVVVVGQDGDLAVAVGARDAALRRLAGDQPALGVEEQAVGAGVLAVDGRLAVAAPAG